MSFLKITINSNSDNFIYLFESCSLIKLKNGDIGGIIKKDNLEILKREGIKFKIIDNDIQKTYKINSKYVKSNSFPDGSMNGFYTYNEIENFQVSLVFSCNL